jgi:hypothetical protein
VTIKKELESLFAKLGKQSLEERKRELKLEMQKAEEEEGDDAKAAKLFGEYQKLLR